MNSMATKQIGNPWQLNDIGHRFTHGVVRMATYLRHLPNVDPPVSVPHLLFAAVELLPQDIQPPPQVGWVSSGSLRGLGKSSERLYYACLVTSASDALRWYQECRKGKWHVPKEVDGVLSLEFNDSKLAHSLPQLMEEPSWPRLALNTDRSRLPFIPLCWKATSTHHMLADDDTWEAPWIESQGEKAVAFLGDVLGFDVCEWSELLGSVHLIVPDPWLRDVRVGFDESAGDLTIGIDNRPGVTPPPLHLTVWQRRQSGIDYFSEGPVGLGHNQIPMGSEPGEIGVLVSCPDGLLFKKGPVGFIAAVRFNMALGSRRRVKITGLREDVDYETTTFAHSRVTVGEPAKPGGALVLAAGRDRRRLARAGRDHQFWFDDERDRAHDTIRELIGRARERVFIVDTYFGGEAAWRFLTSTSVEVRVIGSQMFLRKQFEAKDSRACTPLAKSAEQALAKPHEITGLPVGGRHESPTTNEDVLLNALRGLRAAGITNFAMKKLKGRRQSPIHDRLLVVDDEAWLLGSSFKDFGNRGTMLVKLPKPQPVIDLVVGYWQSDLCMDLHVEEESDD